MVVIHYRRAKAGTTPGWARAPIPMDPATAVLHYAQEIFEGLKAYPARDGGIALFRPDANARRFRESAERMAMAQLPEELFHRLDRGAGPIDGLGPDRRRGPLSAAFHVRQRGFLGVRPSREYLYVLIASPVGSYFKGGVKPVTVWVSDGLHPRRARRHRRGEVRRQLRREPRSPRPRRSSTAATRWCSSTPSEHAGSRSSAA